MRYLIGCIYLLLVCSLPLTAQKGNPFFWQKVSFKAAGKPPIAISSIGISQQLDKRVMRTYLQAVEKQAQIPEGHQVLLGEPVLGITKTQALCPQELYPAQTFLRNSDQTGKYLIARNNRLFLRELKRMEKIWQEIDQTLPLLQQEATQFVQPADFISWLTDRIPSQTTQLLIGEVHRYPEIHDTVAKLVKNLRHKYPTRFIILFTEFLPENSTWQYGNQYNLFPKEIRYLFPTWDRIVSNGVRVIGLDPESTIDDPCFVRYSTPSGLIGEWSVWGTLEGVRIRNERWLKTLASYRQQYPDALFIVYAGDDHLLYGRPFSIADNSPHEKNFMVSLSPDKKLTYEPSRFSFVNVSKTLPASDSLERLTKQADFPQQVLSWSSPALAKVAGFDVRIKVPVDPERER